jgi:hypothetical protein
VLHQRCGLPVLRIIALQAFAESDHHRAVEVRVFAVALFVSAPTRIASNVSVWRSDDDSTLAVFRTLKNVASFVAFNFASLPQYLRIPGLAKPNALWKGRRWNGQGVAPFSWSTLRQPVNAFDVSTALDAETRHTRICIEALDLLVDRH